MVGLCTLALYGVLLAFFFVKGKMTSLGDLRHLFGIAALRSREESYVEIELLMLLQSPAAINRKFGSRTFYKSTQLNERTGAPSVARERGQGQMRRSSVAPVRFAPSAGERDSLAGDFDNGFGDGFSLAGGQRRGSVGWQETEEGGGRKRRASTVGGPMVTHDRRRSSVLTDLALPQRRLSTVFPTEPPSQGTLRSSRRMSTANADGAAARRDARRRSSVANEIVSMISFSIRGSDQLVAQTIVETSDGRNSGLASACPSFGAQRRRASTMGSGVAVSVEGRRSAEARPCSTNSSSTSSLSVSDASNSSSSSSSSQSDSQSDFESTSRISTRQGGVTPLHVHRRSATERLSGIQMKRLQEMRKSFALDAEGAARTRRRFSNFTLGFRRMSQQADTAPIPLVAQMRRSSVQQTAWSVSAANRGTPFAQIFALLTEIDRFRANASDRLKSLLPLKRALVFDWSAKLSQREVALSFHQLTSRYWLEECSALKDRGVSPSGWPTAPEIPHATGVFELLPLPHSQMLSVVMAALSRKWPGQDFLKSSLQIPDEFPVSVAVLADQLVKFHQSAKRESVDGSVRGLQKGLYGNLLLGGGQRHSGSSAGRRASSLVSPFQGEQLLAENGRRGSTFNCAAPFQGQQQQQALPENGKRRSTFKYHSEGPDAPMPWGRARQSSVTEARSGVKSPLPGTDFRRSSVARPPDSETGGRRRSSMTSYFNGGGPTFHVGGFRRSSAVGVPPSSLGFDVGAATWR
uniref:Uncharacterized protein n=1 Tax=Chromera velia CCMP2878 TaxID=1169474 RepID=A0A0G4FTT5_9ALVE|eukprot:Cvel_18736.t1-p1 / transcript=Cvel_18736.t1 / gene=Cvel_18736 / organism=Chromera_velia_CCMP2878 / gene_product=hypothetical protein / transcript_product=hypothetical protein / location=Cvel_scaffold1571:20654-24016(-) / protein_length=748 / sequence_SO=supercontig / SO=protein_coding / is_pseudo=false